MGDWIEMRTQRLLLRGWSGDDRAPFATLNADPRVMEFLGEPLTREQSDAFVDRIELKYARDGLGLWAVEVVGGAPFIGFVGLNVPTFDAPFMPAIEIGWRLDCAFWGRGYASEAARAVLEYGLCSVGLDEIVGFTAVGNVRSQGVMERIGMTRDPRDDFEHPLVAPGSPLKSHVLYRIQRPAECKQVDPADSAG